MNYLKYIILFFPIIGYGQLIEKQVLYNAINFKNDFSNIQKLGYKINYLPGVKRIIIDNSLDTTNANKIIEDYDKFGNITHFSRGSSSFNFFYTFDSQNKVITKKQVSSYYSETSIYTDTSIAIIGELGEIKFISLNRNGNWINEEYKLNNNKYFTLIRTYNSSNLISSLEGLNEFDSLIYHETYEYGNNNELKKSTIHKIPIEDYYNSHTGDALYEKHIVHGKIGYMKKYLYNESENSVIETKYSNNNDSTFTKYLFDDYGNLLGKKNYDEISNSKINKVLEYIYDGKILKETKCFENKVLKSTTKFTYNYY
jgi:hypothetical protein